MTRSSRANIAHFRKILVASSLEELPEYGGMHLPGLVITRVEPCSGAATTRAIASSKEMYSGGVNSGYTSHTEPALLVSRITPVPWYSTAPHSAGKPRREGEIMNAPTATIIFCTRPSGEQVNCCDGSGSEIIGLSRL